MDANKQKDQDYQSFLENRHDKLNTPDIVLEKVVKSAVGYGIEKKEKVIGWKIQVFLFLRNQ